ncbi:nuclease [Diaphorobacter sp. J5-51]|nr:nuclease [Diaphorobacter sp. J5-51]
MTLAHLAGTNASAAELSGKVVRVADGDTITVLDASKTQHRIRLTGIDAPESKQAFGNRSRESLADLVAGKQVVVHWNEQDRYGRILGQVLTPEGQDANLAQVQRGMAWHYAHFANTRPAAESRAYAAAQRQAQSQKLGLWQDKEPTPPWDWRMQARN